MRKTTGILAIQALVVCGLAFGQVIVSSIIGHVTDATGASVPGARITVTNTETGVSVNTTALSQLNENLINRLRVELRMERIIRL